MVQMVQVATGSEGAGRKILSMVLQRARRKKSVPPPLIPHNPIITIGVVW